MDFPAFWDLATPLHQQRHLQIPNPSGFFPGVSKWKMPEVLSFAPVPSRWELTRMSFACGTIIALSFPVITVIKHPWEAPAMWSWKEQLKSVPGGEKTRKNRFFLKKKKSQDDPTRKEEINKERLACLGGGVNRIFHVFLRRTTALWAKKTRN